MKTNIFANWYSVHFHYSLQLWFCTLSWTVMCCTIMNVSEIRTFLELKDNFYLCHLDKKNLFDQNCKSFWLSYRFQLYSAMVLHENTSTWHITCFILVLSLRQKFVNMNLSSNHPITHSDLTKASLDIGQDMTQAVLVMYQLIKTSKAEWSASSSIKLS